MVGLERDAFEGEAARIYLAARLDPTLPAVPAELVRRLLGPSALRVLPKQWVTHGSLARIGAEWRIYLRHGLPAPQARFIALHELSHWALGPGATEDECDQLAARLLAPRPAVERALREVWRPGIELAAVYERLGEWFGCTHSFAAMRLGEVAGGALALVTPTRVRVRGADYAWPSEQELRGLAKAKRLPGLMKARLRDDPARVVIRAR